MDENLWCTLPEDLIYRVLAWLPFVSLFRAQGVCKKWEMITKSKSFLDICAEIPSRETYFLLFPIIGEMIVCFAFDSSTKNWHSIPSLSFLPPQVKYVEGGAGGLLFFSVGVQIEQAMTLYVCNPMTKKWRELPPMTYQRMPLVRHMVMDKDKQTYKIIVAGNSELSNSMARDHLLQTEVYDSSSNQWVTTGSLPLKVDLNWSSAYSNGILYCIANELDTSKLGIITYDLHLGVWSDVLEELPEGFQLAQIMEYDGQILTVVECYKNDSLKSIKILEFHLATRQWIEMAKLPRAFLIEFRNLCQDESFNCVVQNDKIYLTSFKGMQVLVFDIIRRSWSWLPSCPHFLGGDYRAVGFAFEPNLHAAI